LFFSLCLAVVGVWAAGLVLGASNRFEATAAGLMSATTLVLVALMKNAELRAERAIQQKLDAIASSLLEDKRGTPATPTSSSRPRSASTKRSDTVQADRPGLRVPEPSPTG
jgi:hypothetical protein